MFNRQFPSARDYNVIRHFDVQTHDVSPDHLLGFGAILVKHHKHTQFSASLLHRHLELGDGGVIVHSHPTPSIEICTVEKIADVACSRSLAPLLFHLDASGRFKALEFREGDDIAEPTTTDFLEELGGFLNTYQLKDVIGLSTLTSTEEQWLEEELQSGQGTLARRGSYTHIPGVVTEWAFSVEHGNVRFKALRKCDPPEEGGGHKKV